MVRVNLLPPAILERRKYEAFYPYVFIVGAVLAVLVLVIYLALLLWSNQQNAQIQQADEVIAKMEAQAKELEIFVKQEEELAARKEIAVKALDQRVNMGALAEEISLVLPDSIWATSLALDQEEGLTMSGETLDVLRPSDPLGFKAVAAGLVRLNSLDRLSDVWLTQVANTGIDDFEFERVEGQAPVLGFEYTAKIVKPASKLEEQSAVPAPPSGTD